MAPRFQNARSNGNTLTITVVDNSNPVTNEEIDFRHINAELRAEVIQLKRDLAVRKERLEIAYNDKNSLSDIRFMLMDENKKLKEENACLKRHAREHEELHSEVTNLLDSVRPRPNNPYRGGEIK